MMLATIIVVWVLLGAAAAGFSYAYFQLEYPMLADEQRTFDTIDSLIMFVLGPISLVSCRLTFNFSHGWLMPGTTRRGKNERHDI